MTFEFSGSWTDCGLRTSLKVTVLGCSWDCTRQRRNMILEAPGEDSMFADPIGGIC